MKKINLQLFLIILMSLFGAISLTSCSKDAVSEGVKPSTGEGTSEWIEGTETGHKYIDLGLSVKWATCNVGADNAWDYGSYFGICEDEKYDTKEVYNNQEKVPVYPPYKRLELSDDIAHINWNGAWRTPTHEEWSELMHNCFWRWTTNYNNMGVSGYIVFKVKSNADKGIIQCEGDYSEAPIATYNTTDAHIFLPAAGSKNGYDGIPVGNSGLYQASNLYSSVFGCLIFFKDIVDYRWASNSIGEMSVRPVCPKGGDTSIARNTGGTRQRSTNGYEYVDLGTSARWAKCNIGANHPYEYGNIFAWGETTPKNSYSWATYKFTTDDGNTFTKYTGNDKNVLDHADDAATANWGGAWRMPLMNDVTELYEMCYWQWTDNYDGKGVKGFIIYKAKNDADKGIYHGAAQNWWYGSPTSSYDIHSDVHIFLPGSGKCWAATLYGESIKKEYANCLDPEKDFADIEGKGKYLGMPVRAVCPF
jgi:hypothetical protein